jgi:hypothetical protein
MTYILFGEISGSHGGEYKYKCLQDHCAVYSGRSMPQVTGSRHLRNVRKLVPNYTVEHFRRQPSLYFDVPLDCKDLETPFYRIFSAWRQTVTLE